jgi:hypothetical protein
MDSFSLCIHIPKFLVAAVILAPIFGAILYVVDTIAPRGAWRLSRIAVLILAGVVYGLAVFLVNQMVGIK